MGVVFALFTCTHEDLSNVDVPEPVYEYGSDIVKMSEGWTFDKAHSSIRWETFYLGSAALLTGRFNSFSIELEFDEDDPEEIEIKASVTLSSVNTGEPGRDGGCLLGTFDTETSDIAQFQSTNVELDGEGGYIAKGNLTFHGNINEVILKLEYIGTTYFPEGRNGPYYVAGFQGEFEFLAKTNFGIESSNISDLLRVKVSAQFRNQE